MKVPLLYNAFETTAASASGIRAALDAKGIKDINVVGFAGDGGTIDIGFQALSGTVERRDNIIYICYDNEAYMNTGIQRSGATPYGAWTTTTPVGKKGEWKKEEKKNAVEIMVAHHISYTATACTSYPEDLIKKVQTGAKKDGTKYIHILAPCPTGWRYSPEKTIEIGRLAVESCIFPLYEVIDGKYIISKKPKKKSIKEYLEPQGRFRHLPDSVIEEIQERVDREWERLLRKCNEGYV
ncbi:MAG: thiamine pyrophosphate-dependent enzyme, partial [Candidatus Thermoplasmatota archaeon]